MGCFGVFVVFFVGFCLVLFCFGFFLFWFGFLVGFCFVLFFKVLLTAQLP